MSNTDIPLINQYENRHSIAQVLERNRDAGLKGGSVYVGRAGMALMYLRLAEALQRGTIELPEESEGGDAGGGAASMTAEV